jgi:hypothetical protein
MSSGDSPISSALAAPDAGVASLAAEAGSAAAVSRGRWIALGTISIVMVGALGVGFRPIIRRAFSGNAARQAAVASDERSARLVSARADPVLQAKIARLSQLEHLHRERHPWLYASASAAEGARPGASEAAQGLR